MNAKTAILMISTLMLAATACSEDSSSEEGGGDGELIPVTFQSKWFAQAQFAGYYIAGGVPIDDTGMPTQPVSMNLPLDENGMTFYEAEGLDVGIVPGVVGDNFYNASAEVAEGRADFGTDWISNMIRNVEDSDYDLVHIAQIYQQSGFEMVAPADSGLTSLEDFRELTDDGDKVKVGVWPGGNELPVLACLKQAGLLTDLETAGTAQEGQENVSTVEYAFDPALVFPGVSDPSVTVCEENGGDMCAERVDVASAMVYNELNQIVGLGYDLNNLQRFSASELGCGLLEDFIFTTSAILETDDFKGTGVSGREVAERFVRATVRGWEWAAENESDAVGLVLEYCGDTCAGSGATSSNEVHQAWQMQQVNGLVKPDASTQVGCLDLASFDATIERLNSINFIREGTGREIVDTEISASLGCN